MRQLEIHPNLGEVGNLASSLGQMLHDLGVSADLTKKITLLTEELFANSCHHGQVPMVNPVRIEIECDEMGISVTYCDSGVPFDIVAEAGRALASPESGKVGGIGLVLIRDMPDSAEYQHTNGENRTKLLFRTR